MAKLSPYLKFNGNTLEAFTFYKKVFGGEFSAKQYYKGIPGSDKMSAEDQTKIMHIALPFGNNNFLMGTDALGSANQTLIEGDNFSVIMHAETIEEATRIFDGLSEGGEITLPLGKVFFGDILGMLKDKFNIHWLVNYSETK